MVTESMMVLGGDIKEEGRDEGGEGATYGSINGTLKNKKRKTIFIPGKNKKKHIYPKEENSIFEKY